MQIVRKHPVNGELFWSEVIEVESLGAFAEKRNSRMKELLGIDRDYFFVMSERMIEHRDSAGEVVETYHLCETNPCALL